MSPLSPHPRRFRLIVQEVEAPPFVNDDGGDNDIVEIIYSGKVFPSTQQRIHTALADGDFTQKEKRLA